MRATLFRVGVLQPRSAAFHSRPSLDRLSARVSLSKIMAAYEEQSQSLKYVQKFGPELEKAVATALGWTGGRVVYSPNEQQVAYDLQVDCCSPGIQKPD